MIKRKQERFPTGEAPNWPILEELPSIVWATDCQLRVTSLLGSGLSALNLRPEQVMGISLCEFFQAEDPDSPIVAAHHRAVRGESVSCEQDWAGCSWQVRVDPLLDEQGQIVGCIGAAQKITEQREYERALRKAQDELERRVADRTARLARANAHLRHEIKERRQAERLLQKEQHYLRHMLELQERDRQLISYEIHDGLVQQLAGAIMQFEMFSRVTEHKPRGAWKTFEAGLEMLRESMREARQLIGGLRSPSLDEFGVVTAIQELVRQDATGEAEIEFVHHLQSQRLDPSLENAIFRIVQESLTNARRYSRSERVLVRLIQREDHVRIEVQDWGVGFNPREVGDGHFGLEGIQERARLFGGSAIIKSASNKGTRIVVELPLAGGASRIPEKELVAR